MKTRRQPRVLILIENVPFERDSRVQREAQALLRAGYGVSVISPAGDGTLRAGLEAVRSHHYPAPRDRASRWGYLWEYAYSLVMTLALTIKVSVTERFDVIQACNPPETGFLVALPFKPLGRRFVFDHHDLSPELFVSRYGAGEGPLYRLLGWLERASFATADHVIATNESVREVALTRGGKAPSQVTIARNGPWLDEAVRRPLRPDLRSGRSHLCCWVGVMGKDDGVDLALQAVSHLARSLLRTDCHFAFLGDGEERDELVQLADDLGISDLVSFPGWVSQSVAFDYLSTADLALCADPAGPRSNVSTMIKVIEYMALSVPIVSFDVHETMVSAGEAAVYAPGNDPAAMAELISALLEDPDRRRRMGEVGRRRVEEQLAWDHQQLAYVQVFDRLLDRKAS